MKRILSFAFLLPFGFLLIFCLTMLCSCDYTEDIFKQLSGKKEILAWLSAQYGEEFTIVSSEKLEDDDVIRGRVYTVALADNTQMQFVVEEYVEKVRAGTPIPHICYSYNMRDYYADTVLNRLLLQFLEENDIRYEDLDETPTPYYVLLMEDIEHKDRIDPCIIFSEEELEEKLALLAEFVEALNETHPCNSAGDGPHCDDFEIRCETADGLEESEWRTFKPVDSSEFGLDTEEITAEIFKRIEAQRICKRFIADITAYCEKEGLVWYEVPEWDGRWWDSTVLHLYFSTPDQVKEAEGKLASFVEEYREQEPYLSPLLPEEMGRLAVKFKQAGTDATIANWRPFDDFNSEEEAPPYLRFDTYYADYADIWRDELDEQQKEAQ